MPTLTDVETQVLYEVGENLTTAEVWDGDDELRDALADALDEAAMAGDYFVQKISIGLKEDVAIYSIAADGFYPFFVKRAYLREQTREIECETIRGLKNRDERFLLSQGAPWLYVPLDCETVLVSPYYGADGGVLELDCVGTLSPYATANEFVSIGESLEEALVSYGKYFLLMRAGSRIEEALQEFEQYLQTLSLHQEFKHHRRSLYHYRFKAYGEG